MEKIVIGTRGSKLALWQAHHVRDELVRVKPGLEVELFIIKTEGDTRHDLSPGAFGREGIFTAELDRALTDKRIDLAVHSLKDLPTKLAPGLCLAAATVRAPVADVLVIHREVAERVGIKSPDQMIEALGKLTEPLTVGTSSLRRIAQLKHRCPKLQFAPLRGNLDTRLRKLGDKEVEALLVAEAGLSRLGLSTEPHLALSLPMDVMLPAAGQGALALETRDPDPAKDIAALLNHPQTSAAVIAERAAMNALGAGCRVPAGFFAEVTGDVVALRGVVGNESGRKLIHAEVKGPAVQAEAVGKKLADNLIEQGAEDILKEVRG